VFECIECLSVVTTLVKIFVDFHIDGLECPFQSEMREVGVEMIGRDNDAIRCSVDIGVPTF
jgi:hypothetical protein